MRGNIPKFWLSEILSRSLNSIAFIITARAIGVEAYGLVGYVASIAACLIAVVQFGSDFIAVRELAGSGKYSTSEKADLSSTVIIFRAGLGILVSMILLLLGILSNQPMLRFLFWSSMAAVAGMVFPLDALLQLNLHFGKIAVARFFFSLLNLVGIALFVNSPQSAWYVPLVSGVSMMIVQAFLIPRLMRGARFPGTAALFRHVRMLVVEGFPLFGSVLLSLLFGQAAIMFLHWFRSPQELGWYTAGYKVYDIGTAFIVPAAVMVYPHLAALSPVGGVERRTNLITNGIRIATPLAVTFLGLALLGAKEFLPAVFGPRFDTSSQFVEVLAIALVFRSVSMFLANTLIAIKKQVTNFVIMAVVTVLNLTIGYLAVVWFGPMGAAVMTVFTFVVELSLLSIVLRDHVSLGSIIGSAVNVALIGFGMFLAALLLKGLINAVFHDPLLAAGSGCAVFVALFMSVLFFIGTLNSEFIRSNLAGNSIQS